MDYRRELLWLLIIFVALQIFDVLTTMIGVELGAQEQNPLIAGASNRVEFLWRLYTLKIQGILLVLGVGGVLLMSKRIYRRFVLYLAAGDILFFFVVLGNLIVILNLVSNLK